jgi:hypothetical protein
MAGKVDVPNGSSNKKLNLERRDLAFELEDIFKEILKLDVQIKFHILGIQRDYRQSLRFHCDFIMKQVSEHLLCDVFISFSWFYFSTGCKTWCCLRKIQLDTFSPNATNIILFTYEHGSHLGAKNSKKPLSGIGIHDGQRAEGALGEVEGRQGKYSPRNVLGDVGNLLEHAKLHPFGIR